MAREEPPPAPSPESARVLSHLAHDQPVGIDDLALGIGSTPAAVATALLELEMGGWIRALPGARYIRTR
jgi:predicted Rossmann fold nucleotide-binding protein DprA/Smf involved in DNA uptake